VQHFPIMMLSGQKGKLHELTINQLSKLLRNRTGNKAELIAHLLQADPNIEKSLPIGAGKVDARSLESAAAERSVKSWDTQILLQMMEMMRAEMRAMQREQEAQRAKEQERNLQYGPEVEFTLPTKDVTTLFIHLTIGIKTIADLSLEFSDGPEGNFRNWR
jgi:CHASE3 domain sensor protein